MKGVKITHFRILEDLLFIVVYRKGNGGFSIGDKVTVTWEEDRLIVEKSKDESVIEKVGIVAEPMSKYKEKKEGKADMTRKL